MTQYMLSVHNSAEDSPSQMTDEEKRDGYGRVAALEEEMRAAGALLVSGRLDDPSTAAVVRASNGKSVATDGPFIESKEVLGGFYIVEAPSRDAAIAWAEKTSAAIGMPIEVRAFFGYRAD